MPSNDIRLVTQPDGSSLCGQCCVAMAAGVTLDRAIEALGHRKDRGTDTREVVAALRSLGVGCADRCKRVSRQRPVFPAKAFLAVNKPGVITPRCHWMLTWDGKIYDPSNAWPNYRDWRITSYLELFV
jgi:hypothetical protein